MSLAPIGAVIALAVPGVAATPHSCQAQHVSCQTARMAVLAWQTSTAPTLPWQSLQLPFRYGKYHWSCWVDVDGYRHPYNFVRCRTVRRADVRFTLRWPAVFFPTNAPVEGDVCAAPRVPAGVTVGSYGVTKGIGCVAAARLVESWPIPTADAVVVHGDWSCSYWGHAGGKPTDPNSMNSLNVWCESMPTALTDLTQAFTLYLTFPTDKPSALCRDDGAGLCTWEGLVPPATGSPFPPQQ
jgi:hypothetical protein